MSGPYVLRLGDDDARDLVVEALRLAAERREDLARQGSRAIRAERKAGKDVRRVSVKVTDLLAEADELRDYADELLAAPPAPPAPVLGAAPAESPHPPSGDTAAVVAVVVEAAEVVEELTVPLADQDPGDDDDDAPPLPREADPAGIAGLIAAQRAAAGGGLTEDR